MGTTRAPESTPMPTIQDVYAKFGEVAEAAQLLETELGNLLWLADIVEHNLLDEPDPELAMNLIDEINRKTLGKLIRATKAKAPLPPNVEQLLVQALDERNRLSHSFYRQHNFRQNSEDGRTIMLEDLRKIHECVWEAYKATLLLSGIDISKILLLRPPTKHLPI